MTNLNPEGIILDLKAKMQAHDEVVLAFFKEAGINADNPTIEHLKLVHQFSPDVFESILKYLYPENFKKNIANAVDFKSIIGGVLSGAGGALLSNPAADLEYAKTQAAVESERLKAEAAAKKQNMLIVGGCVAVVLVIVVVIFGMKFRK